MISRTESALRYSAALIPITDTPPGTDQQIRRHNRASSAAGHSILEIVYLLRIAGSCECHRKGLRQSDPAIRPPLSALAGVDFQDAHRIPELLCSPSFMIVPPVLCIGGALSHFRGKSFHIERRICRADIFCIFPFLSKFGQKKAVCCTAAHGLFDIICN